MMNLGRAKGFFIYGAIGVCLVLALIVAGPASALDFDFSGTITSHNDVLLFSFTTTATTVTLFSSSWDDGGFDPILGLWDSAGNLIQVQDDGHNSGSTLSNGVLYDHGSWDSYYSQLLPAGSYTISLSTYANFPLSSLLSGGFQYDSQTPIPIASWSQPFNGVRTGNYEFHLLNVTTATGPSVPEPSSLFLLVLGLFGLAGWQQRRQRHTM